MPPFHNGIVNCITFLNNNAPLELCIGKLCRKVNSRHFFDLIVIIFIFLSMYCCCSMITGISDYNISFLWIWIFEDGRPCKASFQIIRTWLTVLIPFKFCVFSCEFGHWPGSISKSAYELPVITYHTQKFSDSFLIGWKFHLRDCFYILSLGFNAICSKKMAKVVKFLFQESTLAFLQLKICLFLLSQNNLNVFQVLFSNFIEYYNIIQICKCKNSGHSGLYSLYFGNMLEPEQGQMVPLNTQTCKMVQQKLCSSLSLCLGLYGDTLVWGQELYKT